MFGEAWFDSQMFMDFGHFRMGGPEAWPEQPLRDEVARLGSGLGESTQGDNEVAFDGSPSNSDTGESLPGTTGDVPLTETSFERDVARQPSPAGLRHRFFVKGLLGVGTSANAGGSPPQSNLSPPRTRDGSDANQVVSELGSFATEGVVTSDTDPALQQEGVVARGRLLHVKGWWRKGPKLAERVVEVRLAPGAREQQLVWYRLTPEGAPDSRARCNYDLGGSIAEAVELPQHPGLHGFRLHPLPRVREEALDFATRSERDRVEWLEAINKAAKHRAATVDPVCGHLKVVISHATLHWDQPATRRQSWQAPQLSVVVRHSDIGFRTAPRRPQAVGDSAVFSHTIEFPVADDDPDSLVTLEVWAPDSRRRLRPLARIDVPLFYFGRNQVKEMNLPLRDPENPSGGENGRVSIRAFFEQPFVSLLLPRTSRNAAPPTRFVPEGPIREQLKEIEPFLRDFEVFSQRFMYHCDTGRIFNLRFRSVAHWDQPLVTLAFLLGLTIIIGFYHEYILPLAASVLLFVVIWQHPSCSGCCRGCCSMRRRLLQRRSSGAGGPAGAAAGEAARAGAPRTKERYENERRPFLGHFSAQHLRFFDPPAWCDMDLRKADPPQAVEDGAQYIWRPELNSFTDPDGWQYAKNFRRNAIWRSNFNGWFYVRRRKHIGTLTGRPLEPAAPVRSESVSAMLPSSGLNGAAAPAAAVTVTPEGSPPPPTRATAVFGRSLTTPSRQPQAQQSQSTPSAASLPAGGGQSGARTPFHDLYQMYVARWLNLQRHIEYWMDWYERRKNLFLGATVPTQNFALCGAVALLLATWALPTRWLVLSWVYAFFYDGMAQGRLMRKNQRIFIAALQEFAKEHWEDISWQRVDSWGARTSLDEVVASGVPLLKLVQWIRKEFFNSRPMIQLRSVQRCRTLGQLAIQIIWMSEKFDRFCKRERVWYRSTFRNLLDHVPSDITRFQPLTCKEKGF